MSISPDQLRIDGQELQLSERIGYNFQGPDLSDQTQIREPYTHTIKVGRSRENERILGYPSDPAADITNLGAYERKEADIYVGGSLLIKGGKLALTSAGEEIRLNIVGKGVDFWDDLKGKTLNGLSWGAITEITFNPSHNHVGRDIIFPAMECYIAPDYSVSSPFQGSMNFTKFNSRLECVVPFVKMRALLENIITDAGYVLNYDYLRLNAGPAKIKSFENTYISMNVPEGKRDNDIDNKIRTVDWFPEIDQDTFVKGLLHQFGALLIVEGNVVYFILLEEIVSRKNDKGLIWTGKVDLSQEPDKTYDNGYARTNRWEYEAHEYDMRVRLQTLLNKNAAASAIAYLPQIVGTVLSENRNLDTKRVVAEIPWTPALELTTNNAQGNPRKVSYLGAFDETTKLFNGTWDPVIITIPDDDVTFNTTGGSAETWSGDGNGLKVAFSSAQQDGTPAHITTGSEDHGIDMTMIIPLFYGADATKFIREPMIVNAVMNLTVEDVRAVNNLSSWLKFLENLQDPLPKLLPVYIQELNGWFIVTKIHSYIAGAPAKVTLLRI